MGKLAARLVASAVAVIGVLHVAAATGRSSAAWIVSVVDGGQAGRLQSLMFGLTLLVLAHGLAGGRRLARHVALGALLVACVVLSLASDLPVHVRLPRVAALGAVALLLVTLRTNFPAAPDPRRLRLAGQVSVGLLVLVAVGSGWGFVSYHEKPRQIGAALVASFAPARPVPSGHDNLLALVVGVGGLALLVLMFAPGPAPEPGTAAQRHLVAQLADAPGADSLAPFATRRDKSYVFSPDGRAAIGYRVFFGTALAGGDPVGDPLSAGAAVTEFLRTCDHEGWRPGVLGAGGPAWGEQRLPGLTFGDEAVLDVATFALGSRRLRNVRQAVQRTHNAGVKVTVGPLTGELAAELRPVLEAWLGGHLERGFAMNLDTMLLPRPDCVVAVARDGLGTAVAFARFAICAGGRILTLDVAPRRRDAPNGVVERLVVEMVEHGRATGAAEVSLNFAGLRRVFESRSPLARVATVAVRVFDPWIELWPLYRFCAKFRPRWRPRMLLARSWPALAPVAVAALAAELGRRPAEPPELPEAQVCGGVS
jgi:lysylphosphatidylglycerol synthetase-like protein (DUF2156 family)